MSALQSLRNAHALARLVLVWFALFIGVSVASPWVKPQATQMVCSAMGGMKMVMVDDTGSSPLSSGGMDCPLCAHATPALPTPSVAALAYVQDARAYIVQALPEAALLTRTAPPLPSRGPPDLI